LMSSRTRTCTVVSPTFLSRVTTNDCGFLMVLLLSTP
jgi:hypothetical protein